MVEREKERERERERVFSDLPKYYNDVKPSVHSPDLFDAYSFNGQIFHH